MIANISLQGIHGSWRISPTIKIDGYIVFESNGSHNINSEYDVMTVSLHNNTTLDVYIGSYAESSFDYTMAFPLNYEVTGNTRTGYISSTSGKQADPSLGISSFTKVTYTTDGTGENDLFQIVYSKDGSVNNNNDRGYLAIAVKDMPLFFYSETPATLSINTNSLDATYDYTTDFNGLSVLNNNTVTFGTSDNDRYVFVFLQVYGNVEISDMDFVYFETTATTVGGNAESMVIQSYDLSDGIHNAALSNLFFNCTSLVDASQLYIPETVTQGMCYQMFYGCTNLQYPPNLPATTLAVQCYEGMFRGCISLETSPYLPALNLVNGCYNSMFDGCTNLNHIIADFTTTPGTSYTSNWVNGVASTGTFERYSTATWEEYGVNAIPMGWVLEASIIDTDHSSVNYLSILVPSSTSLSLNITTTTNYSPNIYYSRDKIKWYKFNSIISDSNLNPYYFRGNNPSGFSNASNNYCTFKITGTATGAYPKISGDATTLVNNYGNLTTLPAYCFKALFKSFFNSTMYVENLLLPSTTIGEACYVDMFGSNTGLYSISLSLPATTLSKNCYAYMFSGCTYLSTANIQLNALNLAEQCYAGMFQNCSLLAYPKLPATTLVKGCYYAMFDGNRNCSTSAPYLPATTLVADCYSYMFRNNSNLNYIDANFVTQPSSQYMSNWVLGVSRTGTFIKNPKCTWTNTFGNNAIPYDSSYPWAVTEYKYLTFTANETSTISYSDTNNYGIKLYYSTNGNYFTYNEGNLATITLNKGEKLYIYGDNQNGLDPDSNETNYFNISGDVSVEGYITSLIGRTASIYNICSSAFCGLFQNCDISDASGLLLTPSTLEERCYTYMFDNCSKLVKAPTIQATLLESESLYSMFQDCTSLTEAPDLPDNFMFAPESRNSCECMFYGCTSLIKAPKLNSQNLTSNCYLEMFGWCSNLITPPELPVTTLADSCYAQMFEECDSLTTAPYLPATSLVTNCYAQMFENCTKLSKINCATLTALSTDYSSNWVSGVAAAGKFIKNPDATWENTFTVNTIPIGWNVATTDILSSIYVGENLVNQCFIGTIPVKEIYIGETKVL